MKVSFIIPVLNAEKHLRRCLRSIREQDYPQDKGEIVVLDGGCTDSTVDMAQQFSSKVLPNPGKLAEYGLQVGIRNSQGDLVVIFAADNELPTRLWLKTAVETFVEENDCSAAWGPLRSGPEDPPLNRYFELIQSDPMTHFMNRNLCHYLKDEKTVKKRGRYVFRVDPERPLPWGANGLVLKREAAAPVWAQAGYLGDNDAFQKMVERGRSLVAYIPELVTYHHHVRSAAEWVAKWKRNFSLHFLANLETRNTNWVFVKNFRLKLIAWLMYSAIPLVSGIHALYLGIRSRNPYWAYHPLLCLLQTYVYSSIMLTTRRGRAALGKVVTGSPGFNAP